MVVRNAPESQQKEILKELTSVLLPELTLAKFKGLGLLKIPKISIKGKTLFDVTKLKNLTPRVPSGKNLTNLKKNEFTNYGYKIKPTSGSLKDKIDDIIAKGDDFGTKTENIVDELMTQGNYKILDGKYGTNNGFDGLYIKGNIDNPSEIIIVESKQFSYANNKAQNIIEHNGLKLNPPNDETKLPAQMSDERIEYDEVTFKDLILTNIK